MAKSGFSLYKGFYLLAIVAMLIYVFLTIQGNHDWAGWLLMIFFLAVALGFRGSERLKGMSFTMVIFATVSLALYYPQYFISWNGFALSGLITPLIQLIMFGMGTSMGVDDFVGVVKMPKGVAVGVASQFVIMPLVGYTLASLTNFPPEIAAGIVLIGCSPSGMASNVMSYLAKANLALSITITSITTLLAPFVTPLLMKLLAGALVEIDVMKMMWDIIKMVIFPIGAGLLVNRLFRGNNVIDKIMPLVSMFGIAFILTIITAAGRDSLLKIGPLLILVVICHNSFGYLLGYWGARLFKMPERDCRTVAIEVGMQNAGLASGLAKEMGKIATVGLAPAVFGPLMNISGSILASWWHNRSPKDDLPNKEGVEQKTELTTS